MNKIQLWQTKSMTTTEIQASGLGTGIKQLYEVKHNFEYSTPLDSGVYSTTSEQTVNLIWNIDARQ